MCCPERFLRIFASKIKPSLRPGGPPALSRPGHWHGRSLPWERSTPWSPDQSLFLKSQPQWLLPREPSLPSWPRRCPRPLSVILYHLGLFCDRHLPCAVTCVCSPVGPLRVPCVCHELVVHEGKNCIYPVHQSTGRHVLGARQPLMEQLKEGHGWP